MKGGLDTYQIFGENLMFHNELIEILHLLFSLYCLLILFNLAFFIESLDL